MAFFKLGNFLERSTQLDISLIKNSTLDKAALKELLVRLEERYEKTAVAVNNRRSGIYALEAFGNGEGFAPVQSGTNPKIRPVYQQTYFAGPLLNAAATTIAHGITMTANTQLVGVEAYASDTSGNQYIPLPYVDVSGTVAAGNVEIFVDGTNINIEPTGDATNFDKVVVTLRWIDI